MTDEAVGNYIRAFRRRHHLSQQDLGILIGYPSSDAVGRHERSEVAPPLLMALAYEVVFDVPVGKIFAGFRGVVAQAVIRNTEELLVQVAKDHGGESDPEKSKWLTEWKRRIESPTNFAKRLDS